MGKRREKDAQGMGGASIFSPSPYHRQMLCGPAQLEEAGDITALGSVLPAPLGLCRGNSGGHSSSWGWLAPTVHPWHPGATSPSRQWE